MMLNAPPGAIACDVEDALGLLYGDVTEEGVAGNGIPGACVRCIGGHHRTFGCESGESEDPAADATDSITGGSHRSLSDVTCEESTDGGHRDGRSQFTPLLFSKGVGVGSEG